MLQDFVKVHGGEVKTKALHGLYEKHVRLKSTTKSLRTMCVSRTGLEYVPRAKGTNAKLHVALYPDRVSMQADFKDVTDHVHTRSDDGCKMWKSCKHATSCRHDGRMYGHYIQRHLQSAAKLGLLRQETTRRDRQHVMNCGSMHADMMRKSCKNMLLGIKFNLIFKKW